MPPSKASLFRILAHGTCLLLRLLGIGLTVFMITFGPMIDWSWSAHPPEQYFISRWPNGILLFGWFLFPYSRLRNRLLWISSFACLVVASGILVHSALAIFTFYYELVSASRQDTLFIIQLSLLTCFSQPLAVLGARLLGLRWPASEKQIVVNLANELIFEHRRQKEGK